ncbi:MAG: hypothetical protein EA394_10665 [Bacteroidia bacterium]|nr:MAG: hypothetical protein EA394_10665 [Bacteroidia bacterium]
MRKRAPGQYKPGKRLCHKVCKNHQLIKSFISKVRLALTNLTYTFTWTNANTQNSTGIELIQYLDWSNNLDLTLTGNFFYAEVSSEVEGREFSKESYSWTLNLQGNINIPGWFSSQVSANYWGPRVILQGEIKSVFSLSAGFRRNVLNNMGTISLNVTDVFNSRKFSLATTNDQFFQEREFFRESRVLTLGFTYRFGGFRERLFCALQHPKFNTKNL